MNNFVTTAVFLFCTRYGSKGIQLCLGLSKFYRIS